MKLKPLAGYILIEPLDEEETTASGLVLPEKAKEKPAKGKVIAVGEAIKHYEAGFRSERIGVYNKKGRIIELAEEGCQVKKGDIVCFHRWSGQDIREGQKEYKLVKFADLMGVYE